MEKEMMLETGLVQVTSRIERILLDMQVFNGQNGKFIKFENHRHAYLEIVRMLAFTDLFSSLEIHFLNEQAWCVPRVRRRSREMGYYLLHAKRITDIIIGVDTPSNDYNDGVSDYGELKFTVHTKRQTIFSSLYECGIIPDSVYRHIIKNIR
jgi:hypothetical protein